jgi:hypothetical protein
MVTRVLVYAIPVVLAVWALVDLVQTPKAAVRAMAKPFWAIAVIFLPVVGPIVWLAVGAQRKRFGRGGGGRPARPVAPDDDPDFLRKLDQDRRRQQREKSQPDTPASDTPASDKPKEPDQPDH